MNVRVLTFCLILIGTCLPTTAQQSAQPAEPAPDIYRRSVRKAVQTNATWEPVESRSFKLGPMTSDGKRLWAVRKFTNSVYVFDSEKKTWTYVGFASLGEKAEWRVIFRDGKNVPIALIVRVDVQAADTNKRTAFLAVSRISDQSICVTDKIDGILKANARVRALADSSANKPCL